MAASSSFRYQHRPLSPAPPVDHNAKRLLDSVQSFKQQVEGLVDENRHLREVNGALDVKVKHYLQELDAICQTLRELQRRHKQERDGYEAEIARLRGEIASFKSNSSSSRSGYGQGIASLPHHPGIPGIPGVTPSSASPSISNMHPPSHQRPQQAPLPPPSPTKQQTSPAASRPERENSHPRRPHQMSPPRSHSLETTEQPEPASSAPGAHKPTLRPATFTPPARDGTAAQGDVKAPPNI